MSIGKLIDVDNVQINAITPSVVRLPILGFKGFIIAQYLQKYKCQISM
jgi:hypothetical protein